MSNTSELACTYAALILHDDGIEITASFLLSFSTCFTNVNVESYWPSLFAKLCQKKNIDDLIMDVGASGDAAAPEEVKEESEDDMVFGLFD
ncbi:hypothetical protein IGI04_033424 [Brassica rapa subsp. trilocularis]|uniref:60S acidic ribosomal protein P1 n=1 Tax=Brassica rapa subsp. trilocularis TaxID=1813537 RepID=A0ABQ7L5U1_BRACM|nr:hypothetical protein IGI04_033424 [Brassica rapa subsp. trilocularis]